MKRFFFLFAVLTLQFSASSTFAKDVSIDKYGAMGDGRTMNTENIQRAIDECASTGGGRVVFSTGSYLSCGLQLRSNVYLYLPEGCELQGSTGYTKDYPNRAFIYAKDIENAVEKLKEAREIYKKNKK